MGPLFCSYVLMSTCHSQKGNYLRNPFLHGASVIPTLVAVVCPEAQHLQPRGGRPTPEQANNCHPESHMTTIPLVARNITIPDKWRLGQNEGQQAAQVLRSHLPVATTTTAHSSAAKSTCTSLQLSPLRHPQAGAALGLCGTASCQAPTNLSKRTTG